MARIVIFGSIAVDRVVHLEEPLVHGAHLQGRDAGERPGGGAANSAVALARAGHHAILVAALGDDPAGDRLAAELAAAGVDLTALRRVAQPSTRSLLLVDPGGERTVVNLQRLADPEPLRLLTIAADALYVRSRLPGLAPLLAELATTRLVVAHCPPCGDGDLPVPFLVASASDLDPAFLDDPWGHAQRISSGRAEWLVVTRGRAGASAYSATEVLHQPALPARPVDTTGAGDAFAAGLAHGLAGALPMARCLQIAAAWGAAATETDGSLPGPAFPPDGAR